MTFITGKHLPRRTFLRAAGATVALPFLDSMVPAGGPWTGSAQVLDKTRLLTIVNAHGAAGSSAWGRTQNFWSPAETGRDFDLTPTSIRPLEAFRDNLTIVSNTDIKMAEAFTPQEVGGDHFRTASAFLTQAHPKQTEGSDIYAGTSLDQLYAQRFGQDTPIPSMQLCIENVQAGGCAFGYQCAYTDNISWASPTEPLPAIRDPRVAFEQLFGAGANAQERAANRLEGRSVLDLITQRVAELKGTLDPTDRGRLDQHLDNVREIERRIQRVEARNETGEPRELPEAPAGVPDSYTEHVHLMMDLQVLGLETDMTRVFSFYMSRDSSGRVFPESGSNTPFHTSSHHGNVEENIIDFSKINTYHVGHLPYLLEKLEGVQEGDRNLLEKTMIVYGSAMGDPNVHNHRRVPFLLMGGANGQHKGGLHLMAPDRTPTANVMLTLLHKLGLDDLGSFGDSTGAFALDLPATTD